MNGRLAAVGGVLAVAVYGGVLIFQPLEAAMIGPFTDIGMLCDQRDLFRADLDPGIETRRVRPEAGRQRIAVAGQISLIGFAEGAEGDAAGDRGRTDEESPARDSLHVLYQQRSFLRVHHSGCSTREVNVPTRA